MEFSCEHSSSKIIRLKWCLPMTFLTLVCLLLMESLVPFKSVWKTLPTSKFEQEEVHSKVPDWFPSNQTSSNFSHVVDAETSPDMREFLSWRLVDHPEDTDKRSKTLTSSRDVIEEAQRVLVNLLQDLLGKAKHVMLMEIATYENKGDPAITLGEVLLLRRMNISIVYYCSTYNCSRPENIKISREINRKFSKDELVILMQGGGNLIGYSVIDEIRDTIIKQFTDRKLILLSQSIWLNTPDFKSLKKGRQIYSNHSNLVMFLRDRQSFQIARKNFQGVRLILAPDMAFGIGIVRRQLPPVYDIIWLKRGDYETSEYQLPTFPLNLTVKVSDWSSWKSNQDQGRSDMERSYLIAAAGFQFLQRGRVVVTDRLHGHILSTLMNIPHVLIDNPPYFKLSSFDNSWTQGLSNTVLVSNGTLALEAALRLLKQYEQSLPAVGLRDMNVPH